MLRERKRESGTYLWPAPTQGCAWPQSERLQSHRDREEGRKERKGEKRGRERREEGREEREGKAQRSETE